MMFESETIYEKAYGCIHVKTGEEEKIAKTIRLPFPEVETHAIIQKKHKSRNDIRSYSSDIMIPGFVILYTNRMILVSKFLVVNSVYSISMYDDNRWYLRGEDLRYAKWIFDNDGTIGASGVFMEGDEIKIVDGPLKEVEG